MSTRKHPCEQKDFCKTKGSLRLETRSSQDKRWLFRTLNFPELRSPATATIVERPTVTQEIYRGLLQR